MSTEPASVLVVEDQEAARGALVQWLSEGGYRVRAVSTGTEALDEAPGGHAAVVLDYQLPDVDGFEVLSRLGSDLPNLPVIMLTGYGSVEHAVEAMKRGAFHYVTKPVDLATLAEIVRDAVEVARSRREGQGESGASKFPLPAGGLNVAELEREFVVQALERTAGNVTHAAKLLGMNRDQVRYRIQKFGLRDVHTDNESNKESSQ